MGRETYLPLDMPKVPFIPPEDKKPGWEPTPIPAPDLPDTDEEPPTIDHDRIDDRREPREETGDSIVINREKKTQEEDDRFWNPMKSDDEM